MVFKSKVDIWLAVVLLLAAIAPFAAAYLAWQAGASWIAHAAIGVAVLLFMLSLLTTTTYTVDRQDLLVRSGPFRWRIALKDISRITPTRSPLSSPALSLDRLRIEYQGGSKHILVSPADAKGFLAAVEATRNAA